MNNVEDLTDDELVKRYQQASIYYNNAVNSDSFGMAGEISIAFEAMQFFRNEIDKRNEARNGV